MSTSYHEIGVFRSTQTDTTSEHDRLVDIDGSERFDWERT